MFLRAVASAVTLFAAATAFSQDALAPYAYDANGNQIATPHSAWLDLRQHAPANSNPQAAPTWVESVTLVPIPAKPGTPERTVFRIRVKHPGADLQLLMFRLFFDDKPEQRPSIVAWDELGTQVLQSGALGGGIDLPTSDTVMLPMIGVSCIDVEVPGDGTTVRGAYMDWMTSRTVAHPLSAQ